MSSLFAHAFGQGVSVCVIAGALHVSSGYGVWAQAVAATAASWLLLLVANGLTKMANDSLAKTRKETLARVSEDMKQWRAASRGEL